VTVPPHPADPATTGGTTTSGFPFRKQKRHKGNAVANTDSNGATTTPQTGPVTTGVEQSSCDADGDGVTDAGASSSCSSAPATSGGLVEGSLEPAQPPVSPRKKRAAPRDKSKSTAKSAQKKR
jgi:hypothetical protein